MKKLLIAASSQAFAEAVSECLSHEFDILVCHTGPEALQILRDHRPELAAVDLMLSGMDGIGVLQTAKGLGICPRTVAFTHYITDYVVNSLEQVGVSSLIRVPCDFRQFAAAILDVAAWQAQTPDPDSEMRNILARLGLKINHAGCVVTEACLKQYVLDPGQVLSTQLYPAVARALGTTATQVERSMGRAIEAAWESRDEQIWRMYFPAGKNGKTAKPTNAKFLSVIAACLSNWTDGEAESLTG